MSRSARLHADGLTRCPWPGEDPFYMAYHDTEWGVPEYDDRALYEKLILDGFQAGLSWITILRKRDNFRNAFDDFDPDKIARYNAKKLHALMNDAGIVRNRAKIEGAVASAKSYLKIMEDGPGFSKFLWDFVDGRPKVNNFKTTASVPASTPLSIKMSKELASRGFKFVGPTIVYAFMQATGMVNDHLVTLLLPRQLRRKTSRAPPQSQMTAKKPSAPQTSTRVWQRMLSGRRLDLLDPSPLDIEIADIAHGLARVARWNGQTSGAHIFSVAQHTLLVEAVMREQTPRVDVRVRLAALLHDAPEYVIGDMISPFKAVLGGDYKAVEKRLLSAIHIRFGLPPVLADGDRAADQGCRPGRGLSRGDRACRLCASRGEAPVRPRSRPAAVDAAGLSDALDRGQGREAVPGAVQDVAPVKHQCLNLLSPPRAQAYNRKKRRNAMIHVCSLAALPDTVKATGASHVLTVMANVDQVQRPESVLPANHLKVQMDDITEADGRLRRALGFSISSRC